MREIGGYIELDQYTLPMLHEGALALNCGRNCLAYLIRARKIRAITLPKFLCESVKNLCQVEQIQVNYYSINEQFMPQEVSLKSDEWLYIVNYYGQLTHDQIKALAVKYKRIIVDQSQAYFDMPVKGIDTLYTCRKFFGVPDGAFLYTDVQLDEELSQDESFERMNFLLGRYERTASEFFHEFASNYNLFASEPIKRMSKLTDNLLHGIDYGAVSQRRYDNFRYLSKAFGSINLLDIHDVEGGFAYPLWVENGAELREKLIEQKIYIPTLWPNVLKDVEENDLEYKMAKNILPIPCDQRYDQNDMDYIISALSKELTKKAPYNSSIKQNSRV